jgi:hypothetical protein
MFAWIATLTRRGPVLGVLAALGIIGAAACHDAVGPTTEPKVPVSADLQQLAVAGLPCNQQPEEGSWTSIQFGPGGLPKFGAGWLSRITVGCKDPGPAWSVHVFQKSGATESDWGEVSATAGNDGSLTAVYVQPGVVKRTVYAMMSQSRPGLLLVYVYTDYVDPNIPKDPVRIEYFLHTLGADLIVQSLTHTPANPTTGEMIRFTAVVKNVGGQLANASKLSLSTIGWASEADVPALVHNQAHTIVRDVQLSVAQSYSMGAWVDGMQLVDESDDWNNGATDDFAVTAPRACLPIGIGRQTPIDQIRLDFTRARQNSLGEWVVGSRYSQGDHILFRWRDGSFSTDEIEVKLDTHNTFWAKQVVAYNDCDGTSTTIEYSVLGAPPVTMRVRRGETSTIVLRKPRFGGIWEDVYFLGLDWQSLGGKILTISWVLDNADYRGPSALAGAMQPGEVLYPDHMISSANGRFRLTYQYDGNLVLYDGRTPLWASGTNGQPVGACVMQGDGNLVIYGPKDIFNPNGKPIWDSGTWQSPGSTLVVQDDGNVVIYRPDGTPVWATNTVQ